MNAQRRDRVGAWIIGGLIGAAAIVASSHGHVERMTLSDGQIAQYIAGHLRTPPQQISNVVVSRGTSLRYGRIGLPVAIWLGSAGQREAMPYVQPIIMVLCAAAAAGAARRLVLRAPSWIAAAPFIAPGFVLAIIGGFAEGLAAACGLWAIVFAQRSRWWQAAGLLAGAILARENAGAILIGLALAYRMWRRPRELAILSTSILPLAAWYAFCKSRFGHIPILDPYLHATTSTIELPFVAVWHTLTKTSGGSLATASILLVLAIVAIFYWRRVPLGTVAAVAGLQLFSAGPFSFKFIGEAARTSIFLQLFLVLGLVEIWSRFRSRHSAHDLSGTPDFETTLAV